MQFHAQRLVDLDVATVWTRHRVLRLATYLIAFVLAMIFVESVQSRSVHADDEAPPIEQFVPQLLGDLTAPVAAVTAEVAADVTATVEPITGPVTEPLLPAVQPVSDGVTAVLAPVAHNLSPVTSAPAVRPLVEAIAPTAAAVAPLLPAVDLVPIGELLPVPQLVTSPTPTPVSDLASVVGLAPVLAPVQPATTSSTQQVDALVEQPTLVPTTGAGQATAAAAPAASAPAPRAFADREPAPSRPVAPAGPVRSAPVGSTPIGWAPAPINSGAQRIAASDFSSAAFLPTSTSGGTPWWFFATTAFGWRSALVLSRLERPG